MNHHSFSRPLGRRGFLKSSGALAAGVSLGGLSRLSAQEAIAAAAAGEKLAGGVPNAEKLGWRVGVQIYTFHKFTLFEAIDMTASLGLKYIETFWGQRISKDIDQPFGSGLAADLQKKVKDKMAAAGLTHTSHYEYLMPEFGPKVFNSCKEMGVEMLISDPKRAESGPGSIDTYEKLAEENQVVLALTNHPKPSAYWDPDLVVEDCKGRSKWVGASSDFGHFMRGGFAPMDSVKKYLGIDKMYEFHFRDVDKIGPDGKDVPLGEGVADIKGILTLLHEKKVSPIFSLEYERDFDNPMAQVVPSVNYFDKICGELLAASK